MRWRGAVDIYSLYLSDVTQGQDLKEEREKERNSQQNGWIMVFLLKTGMGVN